MASPDNRPQSEEFERYNQFRVELPDPERLYYALDHAYQIRPEGFIPDFKIGTSYSENGLFSQINVQAEMVDDAYLLRGGYSISINLKYQNPSYQYWKEDQVSQLQELLTHPYGYRNIEHQTNNYTHSLIIRDHAAQLLYDLDLGLENEATAWAYQVEVANDVLNKELKGEKDSFYNKLVGLSDQEVLEYLINTHFPTPIDSSIEIKSIDADPNRPSSFDLLQHPIVDAFTDKAQAIEMFTDTTEKWAKFIKDAVNAMAQVKGIPQSGKLTLLPPSEIPQ